jgi:cytochrome P450
VEKGTKLLVPILGLHHDSKYYPDPERFDPERFSEEEKRKRPKFSYLPFGEGPRMCIGELGLCSLIHIRRIVRHLNCHRIEFNTWKPAVLTRPFTFV